MSTRLISVSVPSIDGISDAEELIVYCARVSNPTNQLNKESSSKLLNYLIKHKHWSPFEMASMCVEIKTSRAIAAQILRHRSFSFQEFSQRYSESQELEHIEWRKQGLTNRQVGDEVVTIPQDLKTEIDKHQLESRRLYKQLIDKGIAKECARMVLPLNTQTTMYMSGTVRSWIHYIEIRAAKETQKEHRKIAENIKQIFVKEFPIVSEALGYSLEERP